MLIAWLRFLKQGEESYLSRIPGEICDEAFNSGVVDALQSPQQVKAYPLYD